MPFLKKAHQNTLSYQILSFYLKKRQSYSLRSGNFIMFLKTNLGYLSQIALENMQLLILTGQIRIDSVFALMLTRESGQILSSKKRE